MLKLKPVDYFINGDSCRVTFRCKLGEDGEPFEDTYTGPIKPTADEFIQDASQRLLARHHTSKFEQGMRDLVTAGTPIVVKADDEQDPKTE